MVIGGAIAMPYNKVIKQKPANTLWEIAGFVGGVKKVAVIIV